MVKSIHLWTDGSSINSGKKHVGCGGSGYCLLFGDFSNLTQDELKTEYCEEKFTLKGYHSSIEHTTNQREEIRAVILGLKRIKNDELQIDVFSDSAYLINCMNQKWYVNWRTNGWKTSKKQPVENQDLWEELLEVIEDNFFNIKWNKVKSHIGIFYNELCDELANIGTDEAKERWDNEYSK